MPDPYSLEQLDIDAAKVVDDFLESTKAVQEQWVSDLDVIHERAKALPKEAAAAILTGQLLRLTKEIKKMEDEA